MGAASGNDLAATLGRHTRTEAVAALANQLARLIRPLHGTSPVEWGSGARRLAPVWLGGVSPETVSKKRSAPKKSAVSLRAYEGMEGQSQRRFGLRAAIRLLLTKL
ncbi:MAG: hypothetical protein K0Q60_767 [Microvirga sp.]|jgi:hypothetical protein|nr:hypothetical protein [Microvirga sp.]